MDVKGLDKIYIIHYAPLEERREYLERRLKELGIEKYSEWIVSEKDEDITSGHMNLVDSSERAINERIKVLGSKLPPIGKIDVIMMIQHLLILRKIAKTKGKKVSVIFEDDVLLSDDFPNRLDFAIKKLNDVEWDVCYTDKGSLFVDPKVKNNYNEKIVLYEPPNRGANTTGSYLITAKSAKKLLKIMKKISIGPDMELSYIQKKNKLKVFWTVPFLTYQGSIEEIYQSNVRKGSLTGVLLRIIRKIEKVSPKMAKQFAVFSDKFRKWAYDSKTLARIKRLIKKIMGY